MTGEFEVIGHRGWPARFPDNTLSGFLAAALVCDAIELDVRRSSDGKLVLSHDPWLGDHDVAATPWSVLAELDLGDGHKPCLLDEAIGAVAGTPLMIEIKNQPGTSGYEPDHRLGLEAASRARPDDVVTSFNWATIDEIRKVFPDVATGLVVGLLGNLGDALRHASDFGHGHVVPNIGLLEGWRQSGLGSDGDVEIFVWATDERELARLDSDELVSLGVSGIITDDPVATRQRLERMR